MADLSRRELLGGVLAGSVAHSTVLASDRAETTSEAQVQPLLIIDTNLHLFQWPFRRLPYDTVQALVEKLQAMGIEKAWGGSFEGLLHRDIAGVNQRLAQACVEFGKNRLIPFGTVNPALPDWEDDIRRCHEEHHMPGIRLYPNYHDFTLADPRFQRLLSIAHERGLLVQICVSMEDQRTQHPKLHVPDVDLSPLPLTMQDSKHTQVILLNYKPTNAGLNRLIKVPGIYFDTGRVEGTSGISKLVRAVPEGRVVFGTHAPFFIYESALIKVEESALTEREKLALMAENAQRLLQPST